MNTYEIYTNENGQETTSHGADYVSRGFNPADAVSRFIGSENLSGITEVTAFDDEMTSTAYLCEDGNWELHFEIDDIDNVITLPCVDYVSVTEAAEMLEVTRQRVLAMVNNGKLNGLKVGNTWVVRRASVNKRMHGTRQNA